MEPPARRPSSSLSDSPDARRALTALVAGDESTLDLPRAALLIAREEYADLAIQPYLDRLDELGRTLCARLDHASAAPEQQLAALNTLLFDEEGFRGNAASYYDPRNSYLNEVLDRRLGIPITLSVVYVEVGRRAGLPVHGVGFPSHFLVAYAAPARRMLVDVFNQGRLLTDADCERMLRETYGSSSHLAPRYLAASAPREILARMLTNLKLIYQGQGDLPRALRVSEQLSIVQPLAAAAELREQSHLRNLHDRRN